MGPKADAVERWSGSILLNVGTSAVCRSPPSHRGQTELEVGQREN